MLLINNLLKVHSLDSKNG